MIAMEKRWSLLLLALLVVAPASAQPTDTNAVDAIVQRALKTWHVPGVAVAIVRGQELLYLQGHGVRSVESKEPVTPDTLFPIASCTKAFTTTAMAILVDEGKMSWDDPVRKHVPYFRLSDPLADQAVTLRDLVCHRTGLRGHDLLWYRSPWTQKDIIRRVGLLPLDKPFRTAFQYQSTMFTAAGFAVASTSGMSWADFVQSRLLDPLDMTAARFTTTAILKTRNRAAPHRLDEQGEAKEIPLYPMEVPEPAGSIQANARDLSKWLRFQLSDGTVHGKRIVSAHNLKETHSPQIMLRIDAVDRETFPTTQQMSYGLGWVIQDHRGHLLWQHGGAIDGFRCHLTLVPKAGIGIALLNNLHLTKMNIALSNALLDLLLELPPRDWNTVVFEAYRKNQQESDREERQARKHRPTDTHPSRELSAYIGSYDHPAYGTARITLEGERLVFHWNSFTAPLAHFQYDTFTLPIEKMGEPHVVFRLDAGGVVRHMKVLGEMDVEFHRPTGK
jgi:CubicO group peptidase (beta-lactamase class C family)